MTPVFCMVVWVNMSIACSPCDPCEEEEPAERSLTGPGVTYMVPSYVTTVMGFFLCLDSNLVSRHKLFEGSQ